MFKRALPLVLAFSITAAQGASVFVAASFEAVSISAPGGPPRVQLCGKPSGAIGKADLETATEVKLVGCVPTARVTKLTLCIKNCEAKQEALASTNSALTPAMKKMIANLPAGTSFVVRVSVVDGTGKTWEVPDAAYVWNG